MRAIRNSSRVRRVLAVSFVSVSAVVGHADRASGTEGVGKTAEQAQSAWSSASKGFTGAHDRKGVFNDIRPALKKGMSRAEVERLLGTANAGSQWEGGSLWTYALNRGCSAQLLFDRMTNLDQVVVVEYPYDQVVHGAGGEWRIDGDKLPQAVEKDSLGGMWRATTSLPWGWYRDKIEIAKRLLKYVKGSQMNDVRGLLGPPDGVLTNGEESIWTYICDRNNTFLQVFIDKNDNAGKVCLRTRDWQTGALNESMSAGSDLGPEEAQLADKAAWQSTGPRYEMTSDRRGIGKKMVTYIRTGMTKEEVEQLMGKPENVGSNGHMPEIWHYTLHTDALISIDFDAQGKVSSVRL